MGGPGRGIRGTFSQAEELGRWRVLQHLLHKNALVPAPCDAVAAGSGFRLGHQRHLRRLLHRLEHKHIRAVVHFCLCHHGPQSWGPTLPEHRGPRVLCTL